MHEPIFTSPDNLRTPHKIHAILFADEVAPVFSRFSVCASRRVTKPALTALTLCACIFISSGARAADSVENIQISESLTIEEYSEPERRFVDVVKKHIFLNFGAFATPTGQNKRNLFIGSGGVDFAGEKFQLFAEGRAWKENIRFNQEKVSGLGPDKRTVKLSSDRVEIAEAYFSFSPFSALNIKVGRRKVVWGQFNVLSPVFFTLPSTTKSLGTEFSKVNFGLAQNNAQISLVPHERIEIQGYFFLQTIIDPLLADFVRDRYGTKRKDLQDRNQYALRAVFYPSWGTVALTYYRGRNGFFVNLGETVTAEMNSYKVSPNLSKLESYSVEASVPRGRWDFKGEFSFRKSEEYLEFVDTSSSSLPPVSGADTPRQAYWRWVVEKNRGRLYGDAITLFGGIGFEYMAERWSVDVGGYFFYEEFTGGAKRGADLASAYTDDPNEGLLGAPFLNASYFITRDGKTFVGLTAGFLGSYGAGASLYVVKNFDKVDRLGAGTLQLVAGLDVLRYFSDDQISQISDENGRYKLDDDIVVAPRFGLVWKF